MEDRYGFCSFMGGNQVGSRIVTDLLWLNHFALMVCGGSDRVRHRFDSGEARARVVPEWRLLQKVLREEANGL